MIGHKKRITKGLLSVIMPLYGDFDIRRVLIAIKSAILQKAVNLEVVIAEENSFPRFTPIGFPEQVKYVFTKTSHCRRGSLAPGRVRNLAACTSQGEFLYNTDGDVVFYHDNYLKDLLTMLKEKPGSAFCRPRMRRLPLECFEAFRKNVNARRLRSALNLLDFVGLYGVRCGNFGVDIKAFKKWESGREKVFLYSETDHIEYTKNPALEGEEPRYSTLAVHAGGTLMSREQFESVGGYCEEYIGWGCHDADIQWKLECRYNIEKIPEEDRFSVLHLDHSREYFSKEGWAKNRKLQKSRKQKGVPFCCWKDGKRFNEGYGSYQERF